MYCGVDYVCVAAGDTLCLKDDLVPVLSLALCGVWTYAQTVVDCSLGILIGEHLGGNLLSCKGTAGFLGICLACEGGYLYPVIVWFCNWNCFC